MEHYDTNYGILDYDTFTKRLRKLNYNSDNNVSVYREAPIGRTRCGFDIEHFRIGNGPVRLVYAAGMSGSEIIGVDYVLTLMENIAKGNGVFRDFDPSMYTIDFLPCLNPEGYFTTTYALQSATKNKSLEKFASMYNIAYLKDDENVMIINKCIQEVFKGAGINVEKSNRIIDLFWRMYRGKEIKYFDLYNFLSINIDSDRIEEDLDNVLNKWKTDRNFVIPEKKWHYRLFKGLNINCIPMSDNRFNKLRGNLYRLYGDSSCIESLACFNANSVGVDLNSNSLEEYNSMLSRRSIQGDIYGYGRDNDLLISEPSPLGAPSNNMEEKFELEPENVALVNFISTLGNDNNLFMFIGGTGNSLYVYPYSLDALAGLDEKTKEIIYYTNNKLASTYANELGSAREELTGKNKPCMISAYNGEIYGVKDLIRNNFHTTMLLQLGLPGGNPLAPYKDKKEYEDTMIANMIANKKLIGAILRVDRLNDVSKGFTM